MGDIAMDNFKTNVGKVIERWKGRLDDTGKKLAKNAEEIDKLEAIKSPTPDDKKRLEACKATRDKLRKEVDKANADLNGDLVVLSGTLPDKNKDNEKDLLNLPDWLKKLIKDKGIQVLKGVTFAPTIDFDFKAKKLKSFGIKITW